MRIDIYYIPKNMFQNTVLHAHCSPILGAKSAYLTFFQLIFSRCNNEIWPSYLHISRYSINLRMLWYFFINLFIY